MTSQARIDANRKNAQHSTGPKTDAGKAKSARNALKHGLTSEAAVLPNEDPADFEAHVNHWLDSDPDADATQLALLKRIAIAEWKLNRCTRNETAVLSKRVRHAAEEYEQREYQRAEEIGKRLLRDPLDRCAIPQVKDPHVRKTIDNWLDDDPFVMARQMQGTAQGVDWLLDHWIELRDTLEIEGYWHYNEKYMALRMLGKRPQDVMEDRSIRNVFLACHAAHPDKWKLFDEFQQARLGVDGKPIYFFRIEEFKKDVPTRRNGAGAAQGAGRWRDGPTHRTQGTGSRPERRGRQAGGRRAGDVRRLGGGNSAPSLRVGLRAGVSPVDQRVHEVPQGVEPGGEAFGAESRGE